MNCEKFRDCLDNYENLTNEEKAEMTLHASQCEECASELDFMLSIIETAKSLPRIEPPSDFMDKLNIRIDMEERKKQQLAKRILRNVQRNWCQYAAAAACFALVAVITANGKLLVGKIDGGSDGVISEETVTTDDLGDESSTATAKPSSPQINDTKSDEPKAADFQSPFEESAVPSVERADTEKKASIQATAKTAVSTQPAKSSVQTAKAAENSPSIAESNSSVSPPANTETVGEASPAAQSIQTAQVQPKTDYGIAAASITPEVEVSAYSAEADQYVALNARSAYSLAEDNNNIALGRYYNAENHNDDEDEEPKAIGKMKISSADAQKAMDVIQQYSFDQDGDLYTTDSANLTLILSSLNREDVSYTDYTMESDGVIKFKVVFN
ncbi:MAG: hypothetical protein ACI4A5_02505 [Hominilimicola sp.]